MTSSAAELQAAYDAAAVEYNEASEQWRLAEKLLASATYRRNRAEREVSRIFGELFPHSDREKAQ